MQLIDEYCRVHYAREARTSALAALGLCTQGGPGLFLRVGSAALVPVSVAAPLEVLSDVGCGVFLERAAGEATAELSSELGALERRISELRRVCFPPGYFTPQTIAEVVRTNPGTLEMARRIPASVHVSRAGAGRGAGEDGASPGQPGAQPHLPVLEAEEPRDPAPRRREARSRFARAWEEGMRPGLAAPRPAGPRGASGAE